MRHLTAGLILLAAPLPAQEPDLSPGALLATLEADLNGNEIPDKAILFRSREGDFSDVSLEIYEDGAATPSAYAPSIGWAGAMFGQQPELAALANGALQVISMNEAIGRNRWRMSVTIAKRMGHWRVAGITYRWRDTLDPENFGTCDINLLTERGRLEKGDDTAMMLHTAMRPMEIKDWDGRLPEECGIDR